MNHLPLVTIITPSLNRAEFIAEAIESVREQNYPNIEHIIMDGKSTDRTPEILAGYPDLRVIFEPDSGVYDALNKGIFRAGGEIIGQLNTDDRYAQNVIHDIVRAFLENNKVDAVVGGATVFQKNPLDGSETEIRQFPGISSEAFLESITRGVPIFNAWFFRRTLFQKIGGYNTNYRLAADRDFLLRMAENNILFHNTNKNVYFYRQHPGSLTVHQGGRWQSPAKREYLDIAEGYLQRQSVPPDIAASCRQWHRFITIEMFLEAMREHQIWAGVKLASRGWRFDAAWFSGLIKRISPGLRSRLFKINQ